MGENPTVVVAQDADAWVVIGFYKTRRFRSSHIKGRAAVLDAVWQAKQNLKDESTHIVDVIGPEWAKAI